MHAIATIRCDPVEVKFRWPFYSSSLRTTQRPSCGNNAPQEPVLAKDLSKRFPDLDAIHPPNHRLFPLTAGGVRVHADVGSIKTTSVGAVRTVTLAAVTAIPVAGLGVVLSAVCSPKWGRRRMDHAAVSIRTTLFGVGVAFAFFSPLKMTKDMSCCLLVAAHV